MITPFASASEAMGWLYVHQRCTLLFDQARDALLLKWPELTFATSYLQSCEGRVGVAWDDLGQAFDAVAQTRAFTERVIAAAKEAFRAMIDWHHRNGAAVPGQG